MRPGSICASGASHNVACRKHKHFFRFHLDNGRVTRYHGYWIKCDHREEEVNYLKQAVSTPVAVVVVILVVAVVGYFLWKGASGGVGSVAPGGVGHAGPFDPGGAANAGQSARPKGGPATGPVIR